MSETCATRLHSVSIGEVVSRFAVEPIFEEVANRSRDGVNLDLRGF